MNAHGKESSSTKIELRSARSEILPGPQLVRQMVVSFEPMPISYYLKVGDFAGPSRGIVMYRMPKKRRKTLLHGLHFEVPLIRLVMPLDSSDGKLPTSSRRASSTLHLQTLLTLVRIETPFDVLLKASP